MRLLNIATSTFKEFDRNPPPYVIISHRWSKEEVTYQDVLDGKNKNKYGYLKIEALRQHTEDINKSHRRNSCPVLEWMWIDTCCINKWNFTELTESINSMSRWYQESALCIAYLYDVNGKHDTPGQLLLAMGRSNWFTRGWTLQELLAPKRVVFLDSTLRPLGHKHTRDAQDWFSVDAVGFGLNHRLALMTGIEEQILGDNFTDIVTRVPDSTKQKWMDRRETTREEDLAYCQLGIYGVHMNLIYGEGEEKALARLRREAISQSETSTYGYQNVRESNRESPMTRTGVIQIDRPTINERGSNRARFSMRNENEMQDSAYPRGKLFFGEEPSGSR